jgi:hypothetical protein
MALISWQENPSSSVVRSSSTPQENENKRKEKKDALVS